MNAHRNYRVRPEAAKADRAALNALHNLPDYAPLNPSYSVAALTALGQALEQALKEEERIQKALTAAHDAVKAAQWAFHDGLLGAKRQVIAQYGDDSDAMQSLGLTKKSKRRRSRPRSSKSGEDAPPDAML
jgi:hypothetical protein